MLPVLGARRATKMATGTKRRVGIRHSGPLLRVTGFGELRRSPCVLAFPASELRTHPLLGDFDGLPRRSNHRGRSRSLPLGGFGHLLAMHLHGAIRTANCYSRALNVKRMGRYLKIIMAVPAWTPPSAPSTSQTAPPYLIATVTCLPRRARKGLRRSPPHSTHGPHTFSPQRKEGCLQERCCHSAERVQARCSRGWSPP